MTPPDAASPPDPASPLEATATAGTSPADARPGEATRVEATRGQATPGEATPEEHARAAATPVDATVVEHDASHLESGGEPTEEELRQAWEEELKNITVADILVQTAVSLVNLAGRRLGLGPDGPEERNLDEVRDGIDAIRALVPVLERGDIGPTMKPLRDALSQLQLEYAKLAPKAPAGGGPAGGSAPAGGPPPPAKPAPASRLWVPGR
jgi:hypothetical protein